MSAEQRLLDLGLVLPAVSAPAGSYASAVRVGNLLFLSGKAPLTVDGKLPKGKFGREFGVETGYALARSACLNLLAEIRSQLGSLDAVAQIVELHGVLNTEPDFEAHAEVLDGASDLLAEVFGSAGVHARSVMGAVSLRKGLPIVLRATVAVRADKAD